MTTKNKMNNKSENNVISINSLDKLHFMKAKSQKMKEYYKSLNFQQLIEETQSLIKTISNSKPDIWPLQKGKLLLEELTNRNSSTNNITSKSMNEMKDDIDGRIYKLRQELQTF